MAGKGKLGALLGNIAMILVSTVLTIVIIEFVMRGMGFSRLFDVYSKPSQFWEYDQLLGWHHAPNSSDVFAGPKPYPIEFSNEISINSDGLRGSEIQALPEDGLRVLFLGDSRVAALEVPEDQTFTRLLSSRLSNDLGRPVQVINAGVRGYGTDQSYLYYTSKGHLYNPDVVVFMHAGNDLNDNLTLHRMKRPFGKSAIAFRENGEIEILNSPVPKYELCSALRLTPEYEIERYDSLRQRSLCKMQIALLDHSVLFSWVITRIGNNRDLTRALDQLTKPEKKTIMGSSRILNFKIDHLSRIIDRMHGDSLANGSEFLVVIQDYNSGQINRDIARGVDIFELAVGDEEVTWKNDGHYTPYGHEVVAGKLLGPIRDKLMSALAARGD